MKCIINHHKFQSEIVLTELDSVVKIDINEIPKGISFLDYINLLRDTGILIVDSNNHYKINRKGKKIVTNKKGNIINHL